VLILWSTLNIDENLVLMTVLIRFNDDT